MRFGNFAYLAKLFAMRTFMIVPLIGLIGLTSCVNLAKRHRSARTVWVSDKSTKSYVTVSATSYLITTPELTKEATSELTEFPSETRSEIIKSITAKATDANDLMTRLRTLNEKKNGPSITYKVFPTKITKSILFTVDRRWASGEEYAKPENPGDRDLKRIGDRLSNLEIQLDIPANSDLQFNSWDKFVTDLATVDLGKITSSQQWAATASANLSSGTKVTGGGKKTSGNSISNKTGKADINQSEDSNTQTDGDENTTGFENSTTIGPSANVNFTDKYETSLNLLLQRMKLSGTLKKKSMILRQEGAFGNDLSGNTSVSVDLLFTGGFALPIEVVKIDKFYTAASALLTQANLDIKKVTWIFPNFPNTGGSGNVIEGEIRYKYLYRHVKSHSSRQIPEARQSAKYYYGEVGYKAKVPEVAAEKFELVKPEDFRPSTYRVGYTVGTTTTYVGWASGGDINFETSNEAAAFLNWISKSITASNPLTLFSNCNKTAGTYTISKVLN